MFVTVVIFLLAKHKEEIKKVSIKNRLIVFAAFVFLIGFSAIAIYYAGNWIAGFLKNETLKFIFQIIWMLIILGVTGKVWDSVLRRVKRESGIV
ncbi:hypothetical protein [Mesobacillus selenatarsenatis]|uniref:Uncharacterized protein n=1 Tax=Mesobacillus selenatarsenatis (strain DSM 18680 / JCM 14380 / FERM P-15431 / SF-1) TaxID=1321606 RepID=A0A0A8X4A2_MESS1|nr:hypothetical protein [Mesobacillus selenatarsenatis]GAM14773.1 hypothetical protein SAMD00020551_2927 [Mesobacillus selenatarsenatis SF-1]